MLHLIVNGEKRAAPVHNIPELLQHEQVPHAHWQSIAVACNGSVITRNAWDECQLKDGDVIEIVKPFVGG